MTNFPLERTKTRAPSACTTKKRCCCVVLGAWVVTGLRARRSLMCPVARAGLESEIA